MTMPEGQDRTPSKTGPIFFSGSFAVKRLLDGNESAQEVFEPVFGRPLAKTSRFRPTTFYGGFSKAVNVTLETAAAHDVSVAIKSEPLVLEPKVQAYKLDSGVKAGETGVFLPIWARVEKETAKLIFGEKPRLMAVIAACRDLIADSPAETTWSVQEALTMSIQTLTDKIPRYLELLATTYSEYHKKHQPPVVEELMRLITDSYIVLGTPAGLDNRFESQYNQKFERLETTFNKTTNQGHMKRHYNHDLFEMRTRADGRGFVTPKKDAINAVREVYPHASSHPEVVTGCPASAELIGAMLERFSLMIGFNAVDNQAGN